MAKVTVCDECEAKVDHRDRTGVDRLFPNTFVTNKQKGNGRSLHVELQVSAWYQTEEESKKTKRAYKRRTDADLCSNCVASLIQEVAIRQKTQKDVDEDNSVLYEGEEYEDEDEDEDEFEDED